ncbi:MAG TPA: metallophosphoesterase [Pseudonocardia sp.]
MIEKAADRDLVARYVEKVRATVDEGRLTAATPADSVDQALPPPALAPSVDPSAPYLSRDPATSLIQSAVEEQAAGQPIDAPPRSAFARLLQRIVNAVDALLHPGRFTPDDPNWVIKVGESMVGHLAAGNHPFNPRPATYAISDSARLVLVSDWGTGLQEAQAVAAAMGDAVAEGLAQGRDVHVVHLGDVYYSGLPSEYQRHVLAYWPVTAAQQNAGVTSWSLNGNHDMYSGGFGFFGTLLGDPRFVRQRAADGPTSWFHLTSPKWDFIGLDTAWDPDVLSRGNVGVLADPQAAYVRSVAAFPRAKIALLSHHQYVTAYDQEDMGPELGRKLGPVLGTGVVRAWWWGHEHRCMTFRASGGVAFPRCIGNGGVPMIAHDPNAPIPPPGEWEYRAAVERDGKRWARFGFTVLDLDGDHLHASYRDQDGTEVRAEEID